MRRTNEVPGTSTSIEHSAVTRPSIQSSITHYVSRPVGACKRNLIDQQVLKMIVKDYYPFSIVEDREFVKLLNILNPGYILPSRKTLTKSRLPVMYNNVYDRVKKDIHENANFVGITTDSWTSVKNESYTAVTTHFINHDCELKSYLLSCFKYSESHTSENLKNELILNGVWRTKLLLVLLIMLQILLEPFRCAIGDTLDVLLIH